MGGEKAALSDHHPNTPRRRQRGLQGALVRAVMGSENGRSRPQWEEHRWSLEMTRREIGVCACVYVCVCVCVWGGWMDDELEGGRDG